MVLRAIDLAQHELHADSVLENRLYQRLSQFSPSRDMNKDRHSVLSNNVRDGFFDASEALHVYLLAVTAFKLKETDASKVRNELKEILDQLLSEK
jgi:hypothetical protein